MIRKELIQSRWGMTLFVCKVSKIYEQSWSASRTTWRIPFPCHKITARKPSRIPDRASLSFFVHRFPGWDMFGPQTDKGMGIYWCITGHRIWRKLDLVLTIKVWSKHLFWGFNISKLIEWPIYRNPDWLGAKAQASRRISYQPIHW